MNDTVLTVLITVAAVHLFNFIIFIIIENLDKRIIKSFDFYDFGSMFTVAIVFWIVFAIPYKILNSIYWKVKVWNRRRVKEMKANAIDA